MQMTFESRRDLAAWTREGTFWFTPASFNNGHCSVRAKFRRYSVRPLPAIWGKKTRRFRSIILACAPRKAGKWSKLAAYF
jgi:hypothetical protein